jgi:hypothetical protein
MPGRGTAFVPSGRGSLCAEDEEERRRRETAYVPSGRRSLCAKVEEERRRRETTYVPSGRGSLCAKVEEERRRRETTYVPSGRGSLYAKDEEERRRRRREQGEPVIIYAEPRRDKEYCDSTRPGRRPSLSAPVVSGAAMIPVWASLPVRVKDGQTSSFRHPQPEGETNRAIEVTEATARCIEAKDIVVATDSKPWETVMSSIGSQSRSSSVDMHVIADGRSNEAAVGSGAPIDALTGRTADELHRPAQKIPAAISTCEKSSVTDSIDAEALLREAISKDEISSHHVAPGHRCVVGQLSTNTGLICLDAGDRNDAQTTSSDRGGYSDEEGSSQQEFSSDDDLSSDLSIVAYEKRRILDSIMDEFNNTFFSGASGSFRSQSERSEDASSSSNAANQPASSDQGPQGCSSINAGKKRAQSQDPFSEDEDDGGRKREKKSKSASSTTTPARLMACPFNKHDPKTYSASNKATRKFRACGGPGWETVARLK